MVQTKPLAEGITPLVQRQALDEEEDEDVLQRQEADEEPEEDENLQLQSEEEQLQEDEEIQRQVEPSESNLEEEDEDILQRQEADEEPEENETLQLQPEVEEPVEEEPEEEALLQRQALDEDEDEEEDESLQTKPTGETLPRVSAGLRGRINGLRGNGAPLPAGEQAYFEPRLGFDLTPVRIHDSTAAHEMAGDLRAQAFTRGSDIVFGAGRYCPGTQLGRRLLAHELVHVAQQTGGQTPELQRQAAPAPAVHGMLAKALAGDDDDVRALTNYKRLQYINIDADQTARLMIKLLDYYTGDDDQIAGLKLLYKAEQSGILDQVILRLNQSKAVGWMLNDYGGDEYRRLLEFLSKTIRGVDAAGIYLDQFIAMSWVREHEERAIVDLLERLQKNRPADVRTLLTQKGRESPLRSAIDEAVYLKRFEAIVEKAKAQAPAQPTPAELRAEAALRAQRQAAAAKFLVRALGGDDDDVREFTQADCWKEATFSAEQAAKLMAHLLSGYTGTDDENAGLKVLKQAKKLNVLDGCIKELKNQGKFGTLINSYDGDEYRYLLEFLSKNIDDVDAKAIYLDKFLSMTWVQTHEERAIVDLLERSPANHQRTLLEANDRASRLSSAIDEEVLSRRYEAILRSVTERRSRQVETSIPPELQRIMQQVVRRGEISAANANLFYRLAQDDLAREMNWYRRRSTQAVVDPSQSAAKAQRFNKEFIERLKKILEAKKEEFRAELTWRKEFNRGQNFEKGRPWTKEELKTINKWLGRIPKALLQARHFQKLTRETKSSDYAGFASKPHRSIAMAGSMTFRTLVHELGHTIHFDDDQMFEDFQDKSEWESFDDVEITAFIPAKMIKALDEDRDDDDYKDRESHGDYYYRFDRYTAMDPNTGQPIKRYYRYLKSACFISDYAATDPQDDFAESFEFYFLEPSKLRSKCRPKYMFMHTEVFVKYWLKNQMRPIFEDFDRRVQQMLPPAVPRDIALEMRQRYIHRLRRRLKNALDAAVTARADTAERQPKKHMPLKGQRVVEPISEPFIRRLTNLLQLIGIIKNVFTRIVNGIQTLTGGVSAPNRPAFDEIMRQYPVRTEARTKLIALLDPEVSMIMAGIRVAKPTWPEADALQQKYTNSLNAISGYLPRYRAASEAYDKVWDFSVTQLMRRRPSKRRRLQLFARNQLKVVRARTDALKAAIVRRIKAGQVFVGRQLMNPARLVRRIKNRIRQFGLIGRR